MIQKLIDDHMECPICRKSLTEDDSIIKEGKEIVSTIPIEEDEKYITYIERALDFRFRCCRTCNRINEIVSLCNKIFYYTGLTLIAMGFFVDMGLLSVIGAGCILIGLVITFGIPALLRRYPNVSFNQAKEAGALVEK